MVAHTQADLDAAFADLEHLLGERFVPETTNSSGEKACAVCGHFDFELAPRTCDYVCICCGCVQPGIRLPAVAHASNAGHRPTNYKRIHHWHERISQLLLCESHIPDEHFELIREKLVDGTYSIINKDCIRSVLRSMNMQLYIEKWLQIIYRITGIRPPVPGPQLVMMMDQLFLELQTPFEHYKLQGRKNFLNYNYVFCRLFQKVNCNQFCMFFPLIKSRQKLNALDEMWKQMTTSLGWEVTSIVPVPPFAVKLDELVLSQQMKVPRTVSSTQVEQRKVQSKRECQTSDHLHEEESWPPLKLRRSDQLVLQSQKSANRGRHFRYTWAKYPQYSHR